MSTYRVRAMPIVGAFALLFLAGAGCLKRNLPEPPSPTAEHKENLQGIVTIEPVEIHKKQDIDGGRSCSVDIVYPMLMNSPYSEANGQFTEQVTAFIGQQLEAEESLIDLSGVETAAEAYLADCAARMAADPAAAESLENHLNQFINLDFTVTMNTYHLISVALEANSYGGGAHSSETQTLVNVDLGGNRVVALGDYLRDEKLKDFFQFEKTRLLATTSDTLYPASAEEFTTFINDATAMPVEEQMAIYGRFKNFYLTPTALVTFYDSYEIAPYAAGPIRVELPLQDIQEFIDPNEPLYPVLEEVLRQQPTPGTVPTTNNTTVTE